MTQKKADLILASISIAWGSSNLLLKLGLENMGTFNLIALRFGIAFVVMFLIFIRRMKHISGKTLLFGAILGFIVCFNFYLLIGALRLQTASEVGFLTSTSVILIPLLCALLKRKWPAGNVFLGMVIVLVGLALMNLREGLTFSFGTVLALLAAFVNAIAIITMDHAAHHVDNTLQLGIFQVGFAGFFGLLASLIFETPKLPQTGIQWVAVLGLALICSAYGFVVRPIAQRYTTAEHTGFIFTLEPVFSAVFGFVFLHEVLPAVSYVGALLVLISVPIANGVFTKKQTST